MLPEYKARALSMKSKPDSFILLTVCMKKVVSMDVIQGVGPFKQTDV